MSEKMILICPSDSRKLPWIATDGCERIESDESSKKVLGCAVFATNIDAMMTYFIQREDGGPIKIGRAVTLAKRLAALQTAHPVSLVCLGFILGDYEAEIQNLFDDLCIAGEWYRDDPRLVEFIAKFARRSSLRTNPPPAHVSNARRLLRLVKTAGLQRRVPPWRKN
jgi:hypothetical protein